MVKCAVIADDLTGANATGVMLKKQGYVTSTIMNLVKSELSNLGDCECIAFTTDSRGVDGETAYNRVYNLTKMLTDLNLRFCVKELTALSVATWDVRQMQPWMQWARIMLLSLFHAHLLPAESQSEVICR